MTDLLAARLQMALSLGFHIVFASVGMAMPFFMAAAHFKYLRRGKEKDLKLTKAWSKGVAIFFATGAVSGTALSFELGLLWPEFMQHAGPIIGMPFSLEGTAFFIEAIALGLFLYGWKRLSPWLHFSSGVVVGIAGLLSALFVIAANGWMNTPTGFRYENGQFFDIDPIAAMLNPATLPQAVHMMVAAFQATGIAVAGIHAYLLLKDPSHALHKTAFKIALAFAAVASIVQPLTGDWAGKMVAKSQPVKFATMEGLEKTAKPAPFHLGPIEIPGGLSFLAFGDFESEVKGLDAFAPDLLPPQFIVRTSFLVMIAIGFFLSALGLIHLWGLYKGRDPSRLFLKIVFFSTPLGFIAIEAGWIVTEVGRQPWIIQGVMKTKDALTPMPGLIYPLVGFGLLYLFLSVVVTWLMARQIRALNG